MNENKKQKKIVSFISSLEEKEKKKINNSDKAPDFILKHFFGFACRLTALNGWSMPFKTRNVNSFEFYFWLNKRAQYF